MSRPDGSLVNDTNSSWRGITVFFTIQLGEALLYYGELLDPLTHRRWRERLDSCAAFLADFIPRANANVNYPITCTGRWRWPGGSFRRKATWRRPGSWRTGPWNFLHPTG